jgi:hypothetical protein
MGAARVIAPILVAATAVSAQGPQRRATNVGALLAFPAFYHGHQVVIVGRVGTDADGRASASDGVASVRVVFAGSAPDGTDEIRGEFWDIGRMNPDDPRLSRFDLRRTFDLDPEGPWPRPGDVTVIIATAVTSAPVPVAPSIRSIVLYPSRYLDRTVTITGQFSGRNLMGELPDAPARSRWDFVIRSADAAVWVSGARPKGNGFDLALDARIDTGRWLQVTGVVRERRGLQWLEVKEDGIRLGREPAETLAPEDAPSVRVPAAPPPEVVFSAPIEGENDVSLATSVRIQFSRDIDPATLRGRVRARYLESETVERGEPPPTADVTTEYRAANRVLELRFTKPLERFRTLKVELLDGILGTDGQPLAPWTLTFVLGGS